MFLFKSQTEKEVEDLFHELQKSASAWAYQFEEVAGLESTKRIIESSPEFQVKFILKTMDEIRKVARKIVPDDKNQYKLMNLLHEDQYPRAAVQVVRRLFKKKLPFTENDVLSMVNYTADVGLLSTFSFPYLDILISKIEQFVETKGKLDGLEDSLIRLYKSLSYLANAPETKLRLRIEKILEGPNHLTIDEGEAWSDQVIADFEVMTQNEKSNWLKIFEYCMNISGGQPNSKWLKMAISMLDELGCEPFIKRVKVWFPLVDKPRTKVIESWSQWQPNPNVMITETNATVLKGLVWFCSLIEDKDLARVITALALSAYKKIPGVGPRAVKIGNACVYTLGEMPGMNGIAQLAILKVKVRLKNTMKGIESALNRAAARLGVPADELEEMSVPAYGLTEVGLMEEIIGDFIAELRITGTHTTEILWKKSDEKTQKTVPSVIKENFAEELNELRASAKDIQQMLPALHERLDRLFIHQKTWTYEVWKDRYLNHPLVGFLTRRLIWTFQTGDQTIDAMYVNGQIVDLTDSPINVNENTSVELWHPINHSINEVMNWRNWLEKHQIQQPLKQAHREAYYLTDAERTTRVYSNRYAAHIVKQHQFNSLCAVRGWRNVLKLFVDQDFPPSSFNLPQWGLRVEFWTDGIGDNYGVDTNETGTFYYLATDQVRFLPLNSPITTGHAYDHGQQPTATPVALEEIPPLVFSEVMRDIDLFVGVASVGNDPTWSDGGPEGRFREYWASYSFGDLSATAKTRKQVLEQLIPRLKIKDRCSFDDKFLIVRGDIRSYKIHLGSGNILMSPNDAYLCIVQSRGGDSIGSEKLFLPFEGDNTLAIIISKALMLAEDMKIKDPTIVSQIKGK